MDNLFNMLDTNSNKFYFDESNKKKIIIFSAFADTAEMNDPTTGTHVKRTSQYVKIISNHDNHLNSSVKKLVNVLNL